MKVYTVIFVVVLLANNRFTGLSASNQWSCATTDGAVPCGVSGILLSRSAQHYHGNDTRKYKRCPSCYDTSLSSLLIFIRYSHRSLSIYDALYFTLHTLFRPLPNPFSLTRQPLSLLGRHALYTPCLAHFVPIRKVHFPRLQYDSLRLCMTPYESAFLVTLTVHD
jgi:hypothetical protein